MHARLWAELAAVGTTIGAHDLWLGSQAIAAGHTMRSAGVIVGSAENYGL